MSNFWPFFYFCSDLPKFWYNYEQKTDRKTFILFFFNGFLFFFGEIMYAKSVTFPSGFLCNSLLKEKQKNSIVFYQIFAYIISRK